MRILLLGGTAEAAQLATAIAGAGIAAVVSLAGRTAAPASLALPVRTGGFGGAEGLARALCDGGFTHLIDATHPFAARISANAVAAAAAAGRPLLAFERPVWSPLPGDRWTHVPGMAEAVRALPERPSRIFLAIGRQEVAAFAAAPAHHYLLRLVDPPPLPLPLPQAEAIIARGPFTEAADRAILAEQRIDLVVSKNAGGDGARAKIDAARALGLPVLMIDRPAIPPRPTVATLPEVMAWLHATPPARRGA